MNIATEYYVWFVAHPLFRYVVMDTKFTRTILLKENPSGFVRELCESRSCKILGKQFCRWHIPDSPCLYVIPDKIVFRQIKCSYQTLISTFKDKVQKYRQDCSYKPVKNCKQLNIASWYEVSNEFLRKAILEKFMFHNVRYPGNWDCETNYCNLFVIRARGWQSSVCS